MIEQAPAAHRFTRLIGRWGMRLMGWRVEGTAPPLKKCVFVAAPHTSNWDLVYMMGVAWTLGIPVQWMGKESLFRGPLGTLLTWLGGIPIRRGAGQDMVLQILRAFSSRDHLVLAVAPEGTRSKAEGWQLGFYFIARRARVPLVLSYLDYARKVGGAGPTLQPSGNLDADMEKIRAFYTGIIGKYPDQMSPIVALDVAGSRASRAASTAVPPTPDDKGSLPG